MTGNHVVTVDYRSLPVGTEYRDRCGNVLVKQSADTDRSWGPWMVRVERIPLFVNADGSARR